MAGFRIPGLPPITPPEVADDDALVIFDRSTDTTKQVPVGPALGDLLGGIVSIPPGGSFALPPGTEAAPSLIWSDDVDTGLYKPDPHEIGVSIDGVRQMSVGGAGVTIEGDLNVTGDINGGEGNFDERYVQKVETFEIGGPAAANMWPKLSSDGKLDPTLLRNSVTSYKGQIHAELVPPPAALNGDFYMQAVDGTTSASWGAAANLPIKAGDFLSFSTVQGWQIVQSSVSPEAYVKRDGDTMIGKLTTVDSKLAEAGFRLLPGVAPTAPLNGDMWATASGFFGRVNGATYPFLTGGGTGLFADGTVGQPSISFVNDPDTGIYRPAADTLGIVTGSAESMRIAGGNVVINGTTALNASPGAGTLTINGSTGSRLTFATNGGEAGSLQGALNSFSISSAGASSHLLFFTNGFERMRIVGSTGSYGGYVGIGVTSPVSPLTVAGQIASAGDNPGITFHKADLSAAMGWIHYDTAAKMLSIANGDVAGAMNFRVGATSRMFIQSNGFVGIGTTTPGQLLEVSKDVPASYAGIALTNTAANGYNQYLLQIGAAGANGIAGVQYAPGAFASFGVVANDTTTPVRFVTSNNTERMRITPAGNVGIGTADPAGGSGVGNIASTTCIAGPLKLPYIGTNTAGKAAPLTFGIFDNENYTAGSPSTGNAVGLQFAGWNQLGNGSAVIQSGGDSGSGGIVLQARSKDAGIVNQMALFYPSQIHLSTNNTLAMFIDSVGRVGMGGHTSPNCDLHISKSTGVNVRVAVGNPNGYTSLNTEPTGWGELRVYSGKGLVFGADDLGGGKAEWGRFSPNGYLGLNPYGRAVRGRIDSVNTAAATDWSGANALVLGEVSANADYYTKYGMYINPGGAWIGSIQQISNTSPAPLVLNPAGGEVGIGNGQPGFLLDCKSAYPAVRCYNTSNNCSMLIESASNGGNVGTTSGSNLYICTSGGQRMVLSGDGVVFAPNSTNFMSLGGSANLFTALWAANNVIQTSDQRMKTPLVGLTPAELAAAKTIAQGIGSYRWLDTDKLGDRQHIGVIAQAVVAAMEAQGLDPFAYGFVRYDEWDAEEAIERVEAEPATFDPETGEELTPAVHNQMSSPGREAGNAYSVVYSELAMFIAAAQEQRLAEQEATQVSLEARLAALERPRPRGPRN